MEIGAGPYFKPYERGSASVQAAEVAEPAADAAVVAAHLIAAITSSERSTAHERGNVVFGVPKTSIQWFFRFNHWALSVSVRFTPTQQATA